MKRFLILFILVTAVSQAQEVKTQNDILVIPNTTLSDYNLRTGNNNIVPVKVSKGAYKDMGYAMVNKQFQYAKGDYSLETLSFKDRKLVRKDNVFNYGNKFIKPQKFGFNYSYNSKGILSKRESNKDDKGSFDIATYTFNSNGVIKKINETGVLGNGKTYNKSKNFIKKGNSLFYTFENGTKTLEIKNGLVTKITTFNKSANKNYINTYTYDTKGNLAFEDRGTSNYSYILNNKNLIEKEVQKSYTQHYRYVYDKYGNWIVAYQLAVTEKNYSGEKTKPQLYGTSFSFYVREIKYSNGEVTGGKTPEHSNIKSSLLKIRSELYDELIHGKKAYVAKFKYSSLGFPNTELVEDFGLKIGGKNIVPKQVNEKQYDQRPKRGSEEITSKIVREAYKTFDPKIKKIKAFNAVRNGKTTYDNFTYNSAGKLKTYTSKGGYTDTKKTFSYESDGDLSYRTSFNAEVEGTEQSLKKTDYGFISSGLTHQKFYLKNNLLEKTVANYNSKEPSERFKTYNDKGKIIKDEGSFYVTTYTYNTNGDIIIQKESSKNTSSVTTRKFAYAYDKYGNWIISMRDTDVSYAQGIPSYPNPTLREITYSNGETTGTTDITKVKNELISLRKKVKSLNTNTGSQVATWKKTSKDNFRFYLSNKELGKATNVFLGNHLLLFDIEDRQLYLLENFNSATLNKLLRAKKIEVDTKNGYWFKKQNGGVVVHTNAGEYIKKSKLYSYAPNQIDVFYQGENQPNKVVLMNYKNAVVNKVYSVLPYNSYNQNAVVNNNTKKKKPSGKCLKGDCENGYGEFQYENGLKAEGFFENGKPMGPMHLNNEAKNESRFTTYNGSYDAQIGMLYSYYKNRYTDIVDYRKQYGVTNDATERKTYVLNFKNGTVATKTLMTNNGNDGCIAGNCTNGSGVYKYNNGAFYFGTFQNGKRHGFGKLDFKGGNLYIGEFQNGSYHGLGTYVWSEYKYYMGQYRDGKYHGKGVMYYNKETFEAGNWENGKLTGKTNSTNKTNTSKNTTNTAYTINKNAAGFNSFSESQKNKILACKNSSECVSDYMNSLYSEERKNSSKKKSIKTTTDYFRSLYTMSPKLAYDTLFKMGLEIIDYESLPQEIKTDLRKRAKGLADGYKKFKQKNGY
ncbi:MAG: hypothetical protein JXR05_10305 [Flavobacteriaceae bacterium]